MIEIHFDALASHFDKCEISIDSRLQEFVIKNDRIVLSPELEDGLHELVLNLTDSQSRIEIVDVLVNGCSSRQNIYFSFMRWHDQILQPATVLWEKDQCWVYRFATPFSHWHKLITQKFPNGVLGTDLQKKFQIYWPETVHLDVDTIPLVHDHFARNFDFLVLDTNETSKIKLPYQILEDFEVPTQVTEELLQSISLLKLHRTVPKQYEYNVKDDRALEPDKSWSTCFLTDDQGNWKQDLTVIFPETVAWIKSLDLDMRFSCVGLLEPGQYIAPHCDFNSSSQPRFQGCCHLYVPIGWDPGCYFKFADVGLLPVRPCIINNDRYVHALINQSSQPRFSVGIRCDASKLHGRWGIKLTD
jgi:hypothetical protein